MLQLEGRHATFKLERAVPDETAKHGVQLHDVFTQPISANVEFARP
jgi:hypothetical protein